MKNLLFIVTIIFPFFLSSQSTDWEITADQIDPNNYYGITVANGVIGIVSSPHPLKVSEIVLNGAYDYYQRGRVSNILKTFNHMELDLFIDGEIIQRSNIDHFKQSLHLKEATFNTHFTHGGKANVNARMMALRHLPYTSMIEVEIKALQDITITPVSSIIAPDHLNDVRQLFSHIDRPHVLIELMTSVADSPSGRLKVAASNSFIFNEKHGDEPRVLHEDWDYNRHLMKFSKKLKAGEVYTFAIVGSTVSSEQYEDPFNEAERLTIYAKLEGKERLIKRHTEAWDKLWESNITIEGRPDLTRDIRSALYHLYSFARAGTAYSLSPMGLSGLGYNGHVFWDTEIWMYPPLLMLQPDIAKSILEYRYQRLEAARQNAFAHGYEGAMFPWESAADGSEDTPVWALTGPFQHHISADIGWACWKYYQVTRDKEWLKNRGWPILEEVAKFWTSRVERNGPVQYDILNVIGANEFEENIDNNAYTNGMAITVLRYAAQAARELGVKPNPDWEHVADNIPILKFPDGTTRENATYDGAIIKQADVNLLAYPMKIITDRKEVQRDLDYYLPRLSPTGPAMGSAILAILYNRLGDTEKAGQVFLQSYKPIELPPFGVLAEYAGGTNPYFATGAGGMLQAVLSGFGGLDIGKNGIEQWDVTIPKGWKSLKISGVGMHRLEFTVKEK
ncbi:MAG TPA: glycoside hydrolase family 65 protein [Saprospiraceae bacterium]|nr:glycoside hydrolase family 65 protein [Saprospiraceae bacterium]